VRQGTGRQHVNARKRAVDQRDPDVGVRPPDHLPVRRVEDQRRQQVVVLELDLAGELSLVTRVGESIDATLNPNVVSFSVLPKSRLRAEVTSAGNAQPLMSSETGFAWRRWSDGCGGR
jgi:hypothetical protein